MRVVPSPPQTRFGAAQAAELDRVKHKERDQDDDRVAAAVPRFWLLERFAVDQLDDRDRTVVGRPLGQDVELVKREERTGDEKDQGQRKRRPQQRQRDVAEDSECGWRRQGRPPQRGRPEWPAARQAG